MRHKKRLLNDTRGVALVIVIIVVVMLTLIGSFVASLGYNQRKLLETMSGQRAKIYYRAQAGLVDANWRIRTNYLTDFTVAGNTAAYSIDVDRDGANDTDVTIGAAVGGVRPISSTSS